MDFKYILAYKLPGNDYIEVECLAPDETVWRLNELFGIPENEEVTQKVAQFYVAECGEAKTEFGSVEDVALALEYGDISLNDFDGCTMLTIATTYNEILYV